jgi:hypothetical protein
MDWRNYLGTQVVQADIWTWYLQTRKTVIHPIATFAISSLQVSDSPFYILFLDVLNPCFSLNMRHEVSLHTTLQIRLVLYTLIFYSLNSRWEDKILNWLTAIIPWMNTLLLTFRGFHFRLSLSSPTDQLGEFMLKLYLALGLPLVRRKLRVDCKIPYRPCQATTSDFSHVQVSVRIHLPMIPFKTMDGIH